MLSGYKDATDQKLRNVYRYIPTDALNCTNTSCCDESHRAELNALYDDVIQCMQNASTEVFSDSDVRNNRRGRPGWNDYRPLSRRLDRCDRMIQNEGDDSRKLFTLKIALCR